MAKEVISGIFVFELSYVDVSMARFIFSTEAMGYIYPSSSIEESRYPWGRMSGEMSGFCVIMGVLRSVGALWADFSVDIGVMVRISCCCVSS